MNNMQYEILRAAAGAAEGHEGTSKHMPQWERQGKQAPVEQHVICDTENSSGGGSGACGGEQAHACAGRRPKPGRAGEGNAAANRAAIAAAVRALGRGADIVDH